MWSFLLINTVKYSQGQRRRFTTYKATPEQKKLAETDTRNKHYKAQALATTPSIQEHLSVTEWLTKWVTGFVGSRNLPRSGALGSNPCSIRMCRRNELRLHKGLLHTGQNLGPGSVSSCRRQEKAIRVTTNRTVNWSEVSIVLVWLVDSSVCWLDWPSDFISLFD